MSGERLGEAVTRSWTRLTGVAMHGQPIPTQPLPIAGQMLEDLLVGFAFAFIVGALFAALQTAGGLIDAGAGFSFGGMTADGPDPNVTAYRYMGQEWDSELSLFNFSARMYDPLLRRRGAQTLSAKPLGQQVRRVGP